jgi:hypothetical protein
VSTESKNLKARRKIGMTAKAMAGAHYVNGAFGARPKVFGAQPNLKAGDGARVRPNGVKLEKDVDLPNLAFFAASYYIEDRNVCGGRYEALGGQLVSGTDQILKNYLAQQDPKDPGSCFTKAGLTPRRLAGSRDIKNTGRIVWGQNCDGWRHFDCIGLVVFALQDALQKSLQGREIVQLAGPQSPYGLRRISGDQDLLDGDMVSQIDANGKYHHIGVLFMRGDTAFVAQAAQTARGVTIGTFYDPKDWSGGCWRWPDDLLKPDAEVSDDIPDNICKPTVSLLPGFVPPSWD